MYHHANCGHISSFDKFYIKMHCFLKVLNSNVSISSNGKLLVPSTSFWQILLYQYLNAYLNSILSLILYNKVLILYIMILYIFAKTLFKCMEITLLLLLALSILYMIFLTLSIIFISLLLTIKQYTSLYNRAILINTKRLRFILQTTSIRWADFNVKANVITNLTIYLEFLITQFFDGRDVLYLARKIFSLQITHNKSEKTQSSLLANGFYNTRVGPVMSVICINILSIMKVKKWMTQMT